MLIYLEDFPFRGGMSRLRQSACIRPSEEQIMGSLKEQSWALRLPIAPEATAAGRPYLRLTLEDRDLGDEAHEGVVGRASMCGLGVNVPL